MKKGIFQFSYLIFKSISHLISAKEAMKVIRKRLQTNPASNGWRTIGLTLTVCCIHLRII
jgi:hypothetical protein